METKPIASFMCTYVGKRLSSLCCSVLNENTYCFAHSPNLNAKRPNCVFMKPDSVMEY